MVEGKKTEKTQFFRNFLHFTFSRLNNSTNFNNFLHNDILTIEKNIDYFLMQNMTVKAWNKGWKGQKCFKKRFPHYFLYILRFSSPQNRKIGAYSSVTFVTCRHDILFTQRPCSLNANHSGAHGFNQPPQEIETKSRIRRHIAFFSPNSTPTKSHAT